MPQGIFERTLAVFLALVAAGLLALLIPSWQRYQDRLRGDVAIHPSAAPTAPATPTVSSSSPTTTAPPVGTTTAPTARRPALPSLARLTITASGGDCWIAVRVGSARGPLLFTGFLSQGSSRRVRAKRLWVRLGASGNVELRLNGKLVPRVPSGTVVLLVGPKKVRTIASI